MNNKTKWTAATVVTILLAVAIWYFFFRGDPAMAKVQQIQAQLQSPELKQEERRELFGQMREAMQELAPESREVLFESRRKEFEARERKQMAEFFALPRDKQIAALDKEINQRKEWLKKQQENKNNKNNKGKRGQGRGGPGGFGGQGGGGRGGPGGGGGRGGPGGGGGGRTQNFGRSSDGQNSGVQRQVDRLDRSTADTRAQRTEYRRMMNDRMNQRGG